VLVLSESLENCREVGGIARETGIPALDLGARPRLMRERG
jgi:hypothetical protein